MKRLILFKGGVETLEFFTEQMASVWEEMGYSVFWYNLILQRASSSELMDFYEEHRQDDYYMFTFNFEGIAGEAGLYRDDGFNFWDYAHVKVVNMVVDHPLYYNHYIEKRPKDYIQIDIDMMHVRYMERFFGDVRVEYMLTAGTELNLNGNVLPGMRYMPMSDRRIEVIFTGNYTPKHILREHLDNMEQEYINFYEDVLAYLIANPDVTIDEAAEQSVVREIPDITDEQLVQCMPNMMYADLAVRFHYRELAIRALVDSGIKIETYGAGYNYIKCDHPELIVSHGGVDSVRCLDMISQSKISLNVMPWFKKGAHDRVFNTALNGAVSLTDSSEFLRSEFTDGENILFYDLKTLRDYELSGFDGCVVAEMTDRVKELLADTEKLQKMADAGYEVCHGRHDWRERAVVIEGMWN